MFRRSFLLLAAALLVACSSTEPPAPSQPITTRITVDHVDSVRGVSDSGRDPAIVGVAKSDDWLCSGTLVAADIVLTARRCVVVASDARACVAGEGAANVNPASVAIFSGERGEALELRARGRFIVTAEDESSCEGVAFVVLDRKLGDIQPLPLRAHGASLGERVRTVGFGRTASGGVEKLVREHVAVSEPLER
jgi:hypothetical protein